MARPKIIAILSSFSSEDWRKCGDYVRGEHRPGHDCIILYDALKKNKLRIFRPTFEVEEIKEVFFPEITKKSFYNVFSKLYSVVEEYFVIETVRQDKTQSQLLLLKALSQRGLYKLFDRKADILEEEILDGKRVDLNDEMYLMQLNHMRFFSDNPIKNHLGMSLLQSVRAHSNQFNKNYNSFIDSVQLHFEEIGGPSLTQDEIKTHQSALPQHLNSLKNFKANKDETSFKMLMDSLADNNNHLSNELKAVTIQYLIHFGHDNLKSGNHGLIEPLLDLYEFGIRSEVLLVNKRITENIFLNLTILACANQKYQRAQLIIDNFAKLLTSKDRSGTQQMALAYISFYQEQYEDVLDKLKDFPLRSLTLKTRKRWMMLCSYYKTNDSREFFNHQLKNYNSFFYNNKNKLSRRVYDGSINLSQIILILHNKKELKVLESFMNKCNILFHRTWILKEIANIKTSKEHL